jgi:hypothetical protein
MWVVVMTEGRKAMGRRSPKDGEKGIRYGTRNFLMTPGQGLVAQDGPWHLVALPSMQRPGWHNFKLYLHAKAAKNLFHLGVSKRALAGKRDVVLLDEHYPGRRDWVLAQALDYIDGKLALRPERGVRVVFYKKRGWLRAGQLKGK